MNKTKIIDGMKIITNPDSSQHFEFIEKENSQQNINNGSFLKRLCDWIFGYEEKIKPYVKIRNLSGSFDQ